MRHPILLLAALAATAVPALAQNEATQRVAREILAAKADSVIVVRATVALTVTAGDQPSQSEDRSIETVGTAVSASGLVLLPASSIDPGAFADGRTVRGPAGPMRLSVVSEVKEAFLVLADGTEIAAKVVLKDKDLNLALLAPLTAPATPLVAVDTAVSAELAVADEVIVLGRMGKSLERAPRVDIDSVCATVAKPRPLAVIHLPYPGSPVFDAKGRFAGLTSGKPAAEGEDGESGAMGMTPVVVPAATIVRFLEAGAKAAAAAAAAPAPAAAPVPAGK